MSTDLLNQTLKIVLASASPRRRHLLELLGMETVVLPTDIDEKIITARTPREYALKVAMAKAVAADDLVDGPALVIAADTIVTMNGKIYGKPDSPEHAKEMLSILSGNEHQVITAVAVREAGKSTLLDTVLSNVTLKKLTETEIENYIASGESMDKAGSYAIQGMGGKLVERVGGDYYNVIGLPLEKLLVMLAGYIDVKPYRAKLNTLSPRDVLPC